MLGFFLIFGYKNKKKHNNKIKGLQQISRIKQGYGKIALGTTGCYIYSSRWYPKQFYRVCVCISYYDMDLYNDND
jgi:hypothetical protein